MSLKEMATSTVILASPGLYDSGKQRHYFTTHFKPTDNIAGRACYLKVCQVGYQVLTNTAGLDALSVYGIGITLPQPLSYQSINNGQPNSSGTLLPTVANGGFISRDHAGDLVGIIMTAGATIPIGLSNSNFPRVLVHVPLYQHEITVYLVKLNGTTGAVTPLQNITVVLELTPVDGDSPPLLQP